MSSTLKEIHVTNCSGLSLNERFTAIASQAKVLPDITRPNFSRSVQNQVPVVNIERVTSSGNQLLLAQLKRKYKRQTALKLKRRSMRIAGGREFNGSQSNRREFGNVIRSNSLPRVSSMKADKEILNAHLRRTNSSGNLANRLGARRLTVGGAAERVAKRQLERQRAHIAGKGNFSGRGRSATRPNKRGRSRTPSLRCNQHGRKRSRSQNRNNQTNNRSLSTNRYRNRNANNNTTVCRFCSRRINRGRAGTANKSDLPIKARLGIRPGQNNNEHNSSLTGRGVKSGRVQKNRNHTNINANAIKAAVSDNKRRARPRSRSIVRSANNGNKRKRSYSRTRKGQHEQQQQQQRQQHNDWAPRRRNNQRLYNNAKGQTQQGYKGQQKQQGGVGQQQLNNRASRGRNQQHHGKKVQTQQRRGDYRNQGNKSTSAKPAINIEDLDKDLDEYMAVKKTGN